MSTDATVDGASPGAAPVDYAIRIADGSYDWYKAHAIRSRNNHRLMETALLVVGAAIPTSAVLFPDEASIPAVLGALVVVLTGLRSIFHWQENYVRFSQAREAVEAERRRFTTGAAPYEDAGTRDQLLVAAVSKIEQEEMRGWVQIATEPPAHQTT